VPLVLLSPCGVQNCPHGRNRAAVFPDHLSDVLLRDPQFDDEREFALNPVHAHVVWGVHNRFDHVFDEFDDGRRVTSRCRDAELLVSVYASSLPAPAWQEYTSQDGESHEVYMRISMLYQYLRQLPRTEGRLYSMNAAQAGHFGENFCQ
jgi:hypothetical protein